MPGPFVPRLPNYTNWIWSNPGGGRVTSAGRCRCYAFSKVTMGRHDALDEETRTAIAALRGWPKSDVGEKLGAFVIQAMLGRLLQTRHGAGPSPCPPMPRPILRRTGRCSSSSVLRSVLAVRRRPIPSSVPQTAAPEPGCCEPAMAGCSPVQETAAFILPSASPRPRLRGHRCGKDVLTVGRRLGHASASIALDLYGHIFKNWDAAAASAIEAAMKW
jgi:hypothetical protein